MKVVRAVLFFGLLARAAAAADPLVVYAYDSFASKDGPGPWLAEKFQKDTGTAVRFVAVDSEGALALRLEKEKACGADVVVGIDQSLWKRVGDKHEFLSLSDEGSKIRPDLWFDMQRRFAPFDYGYLAVVYDSTRTKPAKPKWNLTDLASDPAYRGKIALEDPRTSGVGLAFLAWTRTALPKLAFDTFWKTLGKKSYATIVPSWSAAYGLFLQKEVDYVLSYTTSPAYHAINEKKTGYKTLEMEGGQFRYVETAAICGNTKKEKLARQFVQLLLGPESQAKIPATQWMYPSIPGTPLPPEFGALHVPNAFPMPLEAFEKASLQSALAAWRTAVTGG